MSTKKSPANAWKPGQSGNPAGKPRGAKNRASVMVQAILDSGAREVTQAVLDAARAGDLVAARLVLERLLAPVRERAVCIDLPAIDTATGIADAQQAVLDAVAAGEITPGEAGTIANILEARRRTLETVVLEERLTLLERSLKLTKGM